MIAIHENMFKTRQIKLSKKAINFRLLLLLIFSLPITLSVFYAYTDHNSPFSCPILAFTGVPCPGCGLTRSFLSLVKLEIKNSFSYHLFGPILFVFLLVIIIYLLTEILSKRKTKRRYILLFTTKRNQVILIISILINYSNQLLQLYQTGELLNNLKSSPLATLIYNVIGN